ncbi:MAG: hypothetical protein H8E05_00060 [Bacteroidetes bacterium]|nr:hypothetical protein [Bacteroidota bacterium]
MKTRNKQRLFFWGSFTSLVVMVFFLYSEYKDQEGIISRTHEVGNRQIEMMAENYTNLLVAQSAHHADIINAMREHHKKEITECVAFYSNALEEAKNK